MLLSVGLKLIEDGPIVSKLILLPKSISLIPIVVLFLTSSGFRIPSFFPKTFVNHTKPFESKVRDKGYEELVGDMYLSNLFCLTRYFQTELLCSSVNQRSPFLSNLRSHIIEPNVVFGFQFGIDIFFIKLFVDVSKTKKRPIQFAAIQMLLFLSAVSPTGWLHGNGITNSVI